MAIEIRSNIENGEELRKETRALPCPFCSGTEVVTYSYGCATGKRYGIFCAGCLAQIDPGYAQQRDTVLSMWNTRNGKENYDVYNR